VELAVDEEVVEAVEKMLKKVVEGTWLRTWL
jgi:hypothetical protein